MDIFNEKGVVVSASHNFFKGGMPMFAATQRNLIFDAIEQISNLTTLSQVGNVLSVAMKKFGFGALGINGLPPLAAGADPVILSERTPAGFRDLYIHERFYGVDHICAHARATYEPFRYCDAPYDRTESRGHERFMQALRTFGMGEGLVVPIGSSATLPACVWLAGNNPDLDKDSVLAIQLIALFAAGKARALSKAEPDQRKTRLTAREREMLQWSAAGKTSWEISVISNLSESTVNKFISDAMAKLGAVTRAQAVVNALRLGEIEL
jgi:LuxR family quorum sensing-dependent transcriptional regulator